MHRRPYPCPAGDTEVTASGVDDSRDARESETTSAPTTLRREERQGRVRERRRVHPSASIFDE